MGGDGSGRHPDIVKRMIEDRTAIATTNSENSIFLPNYSGIQEAALKTSAPLGTGGVYVETDPIFLALSGTITGGGEPVYLATSGVYVKTLAVSGTNLTVYGSAPAYIIEQTGAGGETDPIWLAQSGSYQKIASDVWVAQSGSYITDLASGSTYYNDSFVSGGTYYRDAYVSGGMFYRDLMSGSTYYQDAFVSGGTYYRDAYISGGQYYRDLMSGSAHFYDTSDPHGTALTQTNLYSTYISGSAISGSNIQIIADQDASGSAMCRNIIIDTTSGSYPAANLYTQGTLLFIYTA